MITTEPVAHDYRAAELVGTRGVLQDKKHPDGTIEVIVTDAIPLVDERVLLTLNYEKEEKDTAWRVLKSVDVSNNGHLAARLLLKLEGYIVEE